MLYDSQYLSLACSVSSSQPLSTSPHPTCPSCLPKRQSHSSVKQPSPLKQASNKYTLRDINTLPWASHSLIFTTTNRGTRISIPSAKSSCSLESTYMLLFSAFPSKLRSWENLHLSPLVQRPCLKKRQRTDLGSAPADTF